jgi:hypothetical protein
MNTRRKHQPPNTEQRDFDPSEVLSGALQGDRTDALFFWRNLAMGHDDLETYLFAQEVAVRVMEAR